MTSVLDLVKAVEPAIQPQVVADFRSTLAAIATDLHRETDAEHRSLQHWWQWLDDEGYDRDGLIHILQQFCRSRLGDDGLAALIAFSTSIQDDADGIVALLDRLHDQHADLCEELQDLEAACLAEEGELSQTAGGMSKGGAIATGILVPVGVGIIVGTVWYRSRKRDQTVKESLLHDSRHLESDARDMFAYGEAMAPLEANKLARVVLNNYKAYGQFVDIDKAVKAATVDPKDVAKDLVFRLVDKRVNDLATADEMALMKKMGIEGWQPSDIRTVSGQECVDMLKEHPTFSRYAERVIGNQAKADILSKIEVPIGNTPEFKELLQKNAQYLTDRGRAALAGEGSAFEHDVEIEVGTGVEDVTKQVGGQAVAELQGAERRAAGAALDDVRQAQTGFVKEADRKVKTAAVTTEDDFKAAARSAEDDLI